MSTLEFVLVAHAIIAIYVKSPYFHIFVIAAMLAQVFWRGMSQVVGN
jgi:hypothetical protein